jgi:hypothetical protein
MKIEQAQYVEDYKATIKVKLDGEDAFIPCDPDNRHYAEILRQVKEEGLTIKDETWKQCHKTCHGGWEQSVT